MLLITTHQGSYSQVCTEKLRNGIRRAVVYNMTYIFIILVNTIIHAQHYPVANRSWSEGCGIDWCSCLGPLTSLCFSSALGMMPALGMLHHSRFCVGLFKTFLEMHTLGVISGEKEA